MAWYLQDYIEQSVTISSQETLANPDEGDLNFRRHSDWDDFAGCIRPNEFEFLGTATSCRRETFQTFHNTTSIGPATLCPALSTSRDGDVY
jgi:hypothetical protein